MTGIEKVATPDGTVIAVRRLPGHGGPIVFLHGFSCDSTSMFDVAERCRGERPAMLVDLVGHGASDGPANLEPYSMASVVDQMLAVIGQHDPSTVHLVGYSMGGRVALSMAARAPWYFASLTTISSMAGIDDPVERATRKASDDSLADHVESVGLKTFVDEWLNLPMFASMSLNVSADSMAATRRQRVAGTTIGISNSLRGTGVGSMPPVWNALPNLKFPVLALAGELDSTYVAHAKQMAENISDGQAVVIEGAGHSLPLESPGEVATAVASFLRGLS